MPKTYLLPLCIFDDLVTIFRDEFHRMFLQVRFVVIVSEDETTRHIFDRQIVDHVCLRDICTNM